MRIAAGVISSTLDGVVCARSGASALELALASAPPMPLAHSAFVSSLLLVLFQLPVLFALLA